MLRQHHRGRVTAERTTALLDGVGLIISKRQVVRLSTTAGSAGLVAEAAAVRRAGLGAARRLTVDDTAAPAIGPATG